MWTIVAGNYGVSSQSFQFTTRMEALMWCDTTDGGQQWDWLQMIVWYVRGDKPTGEMLELQFGEEHEAIDWTLTVEASNWQNVTVQRQPAQADIEALVNKAPETA